MICIEPFAPPHARGVVDLILPIQQAEFGIPITLQHQPDLLDIAGFYQARRGNFWVALEGQQVVGSIGLLDIGNAQAALRKMFVADSHRGPTHGVAGRLLQALLGWCETQRLREIYLGTTDRFLAAHRFYEKNGFDAWPKAGLPTAFPVMAVDSRFYRRVLTAPDLG